MNCTVWKRIYYLILSGFQKILTEFQSFDHFLMNRFALGLHVLKNLYEKNRKSHSSHWDCSREESRLQTYELCWDAWTSAYLSDLFHNLLIEFSTLTVGHELLHFFRLQGFEHHDTRLTLKQPTSRTKKWALYVMSITQPNISVYRAIAVPVDGLSDHRWCFPPQCPTGSHTKPSNAWKTDHVTHRLHVEYDITRRAEFNLTIAYLRYLFQKYSVSSNKCIKKMSWHK